MRGLQLAQGLNHVLGLYHVGLAGEDALGQKVVDLGILVGAAVLDDVKAVVQVGGVAGGGQHYAAGGVTQQYQVVDVVGFRVMSKSVPKRALTRCFPTTTSPSMGFTPE